ncbi:hypothetical protein V1505DRAFT_388854 [Lipomyces doorenjongii]
MEGVQGCEQLVYRSTVADSDAELKQALDIFMQRYDEVEQEQNDLSAQKEGLAETKRGMKAIRDQMMQGRQRSDDDHDDDSGSADQSVPRYMLAVAMGNCTSALTTAFNSGMSQLATALHATGSTEVSNSTAIEMVSELEVEIYKMDKKLTEHSHDVEKKLRELSENVVEKYSSFHEDLLDR